jgi:putative transposase
VTIPCALLSISRSSFYYEPKGETEMNLDLMRVIDKQFLETPFFGVRQMTWHLRNEVHHVNEKRIRRLMRLMGLMPIYQKPSTSKAAKGHKIYPYLLRGLRVDRPNQVWCADITYLPMRRGFLYLVAIMDWHTRKVLAWRISNTLETDFCVEALNEAIHKFGPPEIMNTDQHTASTRSLCATFPASQNCLWSFPRPADLFHGNDRGIFQQQDLLHPKRWLGLVGCSELESYLV